jgi:hypothetical protein
VSSIARLHYAESILTHAVIAAVTALKGKAQRDVNLPPWSLPGKPLPKSSDTLKIQRWVSRTSHDRHVGNLASLIDVEPKQPRSFFPGAASF